MTVGQPCNRLTRRGMSDNICSGMNPTGPQQSTAARPYTTALEKMGRAGEAEAYLRGLIATTEYPSRYENELLELLIRQSRFE